MSLWTRLRDWAVPVRKERQPLTDLPSFASWPVSRSGVQVTALTALQVSTVMACVRAIAEGVSQAPIYAHGRDARGVRGPRVAHPVIEVLRRPNDWQDGFAFRETLLVHAALVGNAFVYVSRASDGRVLEMIPLEPGRVFVTRERDMSLTYRVTFEDGTAPIVPPANMWHLRGPSWNTWMGLDAVKYAREAIGLSIATESRHSELHKGVSPGGLLSLTERITPEKFEHLAKWLDRYGPGGDRAGKPLILDSDAKFSLMQMTGVDAEHVETRRLQVEEICRHFRVSPMIVGAVSTPTYASAEQLFIAHVVHCLTPWAERVEQSMARALLAAGESVEFRHDFNSLMRGAVKDRAEFYTKALGAGGHGAAWMTPNEVRAEEGLDPLPGGDEIPKPPEPAQPATPAAGDSADAAP